MAVIEDKLDISWDATPEPNDFYWNYTVSIINTKTNGEIFSDTVSMNVTKASTQKLGLLLLYSLIPNTRCYYSTAKGVQYNVSVFVTNRRGRSSSKVFSIGKKNGAIISHSLSSPSLSQAQLQKDRLHLLQVLQWLELLWLLLL